MKIIFIRHGEKGADGSLTQKGKDLAIETGYHLVESGVLYPDMPLAAYSSIAGRVVDTVKNVLYGAGMDVPIGIKEDLGREGSFSDEFKRLYKKDPLNTADRFFQGELELAGQISAKNVAGGIARVVLEEIRQGSPEHVFLNGTHNCHPEALLVQLGQVPRISSIGGPLKPLEAVTFDYSPGALVKYNFRGQNYQTDMEGIARVSENGRLS